MPVRLLAVLLADLTTREDLRLGLLHRAPGAIFSIVLITIGLCGLTLYMSGATRRHPTLLWFGVFSTLYGVRLPDLIVLLTFLAGPKHPLTWVYFASITNYFVPIPAILFLRSLNPVRSRLNNFALVLQSLLFVAGVASDIIRRTPFSLDRVNSFVVLVELIVLVFLLFSLQRGTGDRFVNFALIVFFLSAAYANLQSLNLVHTQIRPEPPAFFLLIVALGLFTARSALARDERLAVLDAELKTAREIQRTILPAHLPSGERLRVTARYLPMTAVAGDLYDVLETPGGYGFLIADVTGHGMPAALISAMVKLAAASQILYADDPAAVLTGMNRMLCGQLQDQFVTAAFLYIDVTTGLFRYSAAGHPACLRVHRQSGEVLELSENDLPLGLAETTYRNRTEALGKDTRFVLYTDGFVEAAGPKGELFGDQRLQQVTGEGASLDGETYADSLVARLSQWTRAGGGASQDDDLTLLVVDVF